MPNTISLEFGLSSDLFTNPLSESNIREIKKSGFRFLEIMGKYPHYDIQALTAAFELRKIINKNDLYVRSFHPVYCDLFNSDQKIWLRNKKHITQSIEHLISLGGNLLILHGGPLADEKPGYDERVLRAIQNMQEILIYCEKGKREIKICIEHDGNNIKGIKNILDHFNDERIGFCLDTSHAILYPGNYKFLNLFRSKIFTAHLSDNHGDKDDHLPPFLGIIDWKLVIQRLIENNYRGPWHFEVSAQIDSVHTLRQMRESKDRFIEHIKFINCI